MWDDLWAAVALWLVFEGMLPFLSPVRWREAILALARVNDRGLRLCGLVSMAMGLGLLFYVRS
jgi:uncharacterized protein YjeT (DUF2065 family)